MEFAGDNFVRISGDTVSHAKSQMFSWEAGAKGLDVHALAEPTKLEALKKEYEAKKTGFKSDAKQGRRVLHLHSRPPGIQKRIDNLDFTAKTCHLTSHNYPAIS